MRTYVIFTMDTNSPIYIRTNTMLSSKASEICEAMKTLFPQYTWDFSNACWTIDVCPH